MTVLHLIRHGRASAGKANYDELHPDGVEQSRRLGAYLAQQGLHYGAIYCGPLVRQRDTLQHMRTAAGAVGQAWPAAQELPGLSEVAMETMAREVLPELLPRDPVLRAEVERLGTLTDQPEALNRQTLRIFMHLVRGWIRGHWSAAGHETVDAFRTRVLGALDQAVAAARAAENGGEPLGHVALVTSNGVISCILDALSQRDVFADDYEFATLYNTSITELRVTPEGLELQGDNRTPHLPDPSLHTLL